MNDILRLKIIIVSPKYQMNVGYVARVSSNFGVQRLFFVKPRANILGKKAIMFSKHSEHLLRTSVVCNTLEDATAGCDVIVGTTGIWRNRSGLGVSMMTFEEAAEKIKKEYNKDSVVGLLIGRDDVGLNREEVEGCDIIAHIPANEKYPTLNISHALAILLYYFSRNSFKHHNFPKHGKPTGSELKILFDLFDNFTERQEIRNKKVIRDIFRKVIRKGQLNTHEVHALITAFKK